MTRAQERLGRRIAQAARAIEFDARIIDGRRRCHAHLTDGGLGAVPRVEVRHPIAERDGQLLLLAIIALEPTPHISYAVSTYREGVERALARALTRRVA